MIKTKKLTWLLILQAWTMLWVIIGHAPLAEPNDGSVDMFMHRIANALFIFAYSFHMPLFIMISGYLFYRTRIVKGWKYLDMVKEKWLRLGIPYLIFITLSIFLKYCFPEKMDRTVDISSGGLIMNYLDPFNGALQEMWFVAVIFIYFLCYPIYKYLLRTPFSAIIVSCIGVALFFVPFPYLPSFLALNRAAHFFIYFF